jgi:acyl-coenzyme A synthetase/AMP-(fatty) acid ligase
MPVALNIALACLQRCCTATFEVTVMTNDIESKLVEHRAVVEAAVVGRIDHENLIKPEAFVVLKDEQAGSAELAIELTEFCKNGLAPYKYPRWINFVTELPKTATGKIQRFLLRQTCGVAPTNS